MKLFGMMRILGLIYRLKIVDLRATLISGFFDSSDGELPIKTIY